MSIIDQQKEQVAKLAMNSAAQGVVSAVFQFLKKNMVNVSQTEKCKNPVLDFVDMLTSEWDDASKYPKELDGSLKNAILTVFSSEEMVKNLLALQLNKEDENIVKLARTVGYGETLIFLDANKDKLIKLMDEIRNGSSFIIPDKKLAL